VPITTHPLKSVSSQIYLTWFGFSLVTSKEAFPALTGRKSLLSHSQNLLPALQKKKILTDLLYVTKKVQNPVEKKLTRARRKKNVK
jgi:hypothetical protein